MMLLYHPPPSDVVRPNPSKRDERCGVSPPLELAAAGRWSYGNERCVGDLATLLTYSCVRPATPPPPAAPWRRLERTPKAALLPPSRLQHLRQQLLMHIRPPIHRLPPPLRSRAQHRGRITQRRERQLATAHPCWWMSPHCPRLAVWWVCLAAAWEGRRRLMKWGSATTTRRSPPCCAPCDTVHTPTQPSTTPLQAASSVRLSHLLDPVTACPPHAAT
jgi:hypothetical protein